MKKARFSDVLDAAESLPLEAREELVEILRKRTTEERRSEIARSVKAARSEHRKGKSRECSVDEIMKEISE